MSRHLNRERWISTIHLKGREPFVRLKRVSKEMEEHFPKELRELFLRAEESHGTGPSALVHHLQTTRNLSLAEAWAEVKRLFNDAPAKKEAPSANSPAQRTTQTLAWALKCSMGTFHQVTRERLRACYCNEPTFGIDEAILRSNLGQALANAAAHERHIQETIRRLMAVRKEETAKRTKEKRKAARKTAAK